MITPIDLGIFSLAFVIIFLWSIFWKGWALWIAARKGQSFWFLIILIVNVFGILEIIYIFKVSKNHKDYPFKERFNKVGKKSEKCDSCEDCDDCHEKEVEREENLVISETKTESDSGVGSNDVENKDTAPEKEDSNSEIQK